MKRDNSSDSLTVLENRWVGACGSDILDQGKICILFMYWDGRVQGIAPHYSYVRQFKIWIAYLWNFLGPLLTAENCTTKPWQEGTIINTTTCTYLHLETQHITSSSLFLLMLPRTTTSYLVEDLRTPPPNRDGHRCLRGKQRYGSSSKMSDRWVQTVFACSASVRASLCLA